MNASKVYWNPDIAEAIEFENGLAVHEIETDVDIRTISETRRPTSMKDDFLKFYPKTSLEELQQMEEGGFFVILGRIEQVIQDGFWWYMACSCMKSVSYDDGVPFCDDCGSYVIDLTLRYKLKIEVSDATDNAQLILFDSECYAMLHKSCHDMLLEIKAVKSCDHPSDISNLVGSEFLFRVERKDDPSFTYEECYRVKRVSSDPGIIVEYKMGLDDDTPLKQKFAPHFSKISGGDAIDCVKELSLLYDSAITEIEISPLTTIMSPCDVVDGGIVNKREGDQSTEGLYERKKRPRQRLIKVEKN